MFSKCSHAPPTPCFRYNVCGILVAAQLTDADLVEWGVKILVSIPADCNVALIYLAKVSWEAIL